MDTEMTLEHALELLGDAVQEDGRLYRADEKMIFAWKPGIENAALNGIFTPSQRLKIGEKMNQLIWAAIREYIAAEIKLAFERHESSPKYWETSEERKQLEEQSTRMETEVRRLIEAIPPAQHLDQYQLEALNKFVPYGR